MSRKHSTLNIQQMREWITAACRLPGGPNVGLATQKARKEINHQEDTENTETEVGSWDMNNKGAKMRRNKAEED